MKDRHHPSLTERSGTLRPVAAASDGPSARAGLSLALLGLLAACSTTAPPPAPPAAPAPPQAVIQPPPPPTVVVPVPKLVSAALSPKDYRQDGARHLYQLNSHRIYKGQLPPLMHAVGVLQVDIDNMGLVQRMNWMRAPSHAPDVIREIERTVQEAAPFPAPVNLGGVTYTDVWLWDKSGNFQLDTLTEGQRLR
jgi:protein TonB